MLFRSEHRRRLGRRQSEITSVQLELLDREAERADLADTDERVQQTLDAVHSTPEGDQIEYLRYAVREHVEAQRNYLDALIHDLQDYFEKLVELDAQERRLVEATDAGLPSVTHWGSGRATREFLHVRDAADGIVAACEPERHPGPRPINLGTGRETSIEIGRAHV